LERTDILAARLGISLRSLAPRIDLSVASLFGYRNGSIQISTKGWGKLEQAERAAGLLPGPENAKSSGDLKQADVGDSAHSMREDSPPYRKRSETAAVTDPALMAVLERIASALERLAGMGQLESKEPVRYSIKKDLKP
jgi:hypothetical protein